MLSFFKKTAAAPEPEINHELQALGLTPTIQSYHDLIVALRGLQHCEQLLAQVDAAKKTATADLNQHLLQLSTLKFGGEPVHASNYKAALLLAVEEYLRTSGTLTEYVPNQHSGKYEVPEVGLTVGISVNPPGLVCDDKALIENLLTDPKHDLRNLIVGLIADAGLTGILKVEYSLDKRGIKALSDVGRLPEHIARQIKTERGERLEVK